MKNRRLLIPLMALVLSALAWGSTWLYRRHKIQAFLDEAAVNGYPIVATYFESRRVWPIRLHMIDGGELGYLDPRIDPGTVTSNLSFSDDGSLWYWTHSQHHFGADLWRDGLMSRRPVRMCTVARDGSFAVLWFQYFLQASTGNWWVPEGAINRALPSGINWRKENTLHLRSMRTGELTEVESNSIPPWQMQTQAGDWHYRLYISPDADTIIVVEEEWDPITISTDIHRSIIWRFDSESDQWTSLGEVPRHVSCVAGPQGDVIGVEAGWRNQTAKRSVIFIDGHSGDELMSVDGAFSPSVGARWAGCLDPNGGQPCIVRLFDMQDEWQEYDIVLSDRINILSRSLMHPSAYLALYEPAPN